MSIYSPFHVLRKILGMFVNLVLLLGLPLNVYTGSISTPKENHGFSSSILWKPCLNDQLFECGSFRVPLDYAVPEVGDATLAVIRLKAKTQPRLGTIFTNPGGPGVSGVQFLLDVTGDIISNITLGQYDIVSWDPRGVGNSTPLITCGFTTLTSVQDFFAGTIPLQGTGVEARGNFTDPDDLTAFFNQVNATDTIVTKTGQACLNSNGEFLKYMGTTAVVRDMVALSDAIDGVGGPINYWGISYGTVLGNYFVNMFPERVGKVVIDGVIDPAIWATEPTLNIIRNTFHDAESVLVGFASECATAGPKNCTLARANSTTESILLGIRGLIDTAYDLHKRGLSNTSSYDIREFLDQSIRSPTVWDSQVVPMLKSWAASFANTTSNSTAKTTTAGNVIGLAPRSVGKWQSFALPRRQAVSSSDSIVVDLIVQETMAELVISCVDSIDQEGITTEEVFQEIVRVTHEISPTFGETTFATGQVFCHRFPARAVERFTGPFNHTLAHPILIIGNKFDPLTPMMNAQRIAGLLGNSARFLEQAGFGHTSFAENSNCTQTVVREFFLGGKLPANGTVCQTDQALFPTNNTLISPS